MNGKAKTISIKVLTEEERETGLLSEEGREALEAEKLQALEKIRSIKTLCLTRVLSLTESQERIAKIKQEIAEKFKSYGLDNPFNN